MRNSGNQLWTVSLESGMEGESMVFLKDSNSFQQLNCLLDIVGHYAKLYMHSKIEYDVFHTLKKFKLSWG